MGGLLGEKGAQTTSPATTQITQLLKDFTRKVFKSSFIFTVRTPQTLPEFMDWPDADAAHLEEGEAIAAIEILDMHPHLVRAPYKVSYSSYVVPCLVQKWFVTSSGPLAEKPESLILTTLGLTRTFIVTSRGGRHDVRVRVLTASRSLSLAIGLT